MAHPVSHFQIVGPNGRQLHKFYKQVFGWTLNPMEGSGDMQHVSPEKRGISGGIATALPGQLGVTVYIDVDDIDAHGKKITKAGGTVSFAKHELPAGMGFIGGFHDPAGNYIGLWSPPVKAGKAGKKGEKKAAKAEKKAAKKNLSAPKTSAKAPKAKKAKAAPKAKTKR